MRVGWSHLTHATADATAGGGKASSKPYQAQPLQPPSSTKAQPKGSSSSGGGSGVEESPSDGVQQLVTQARAAAQQQRWLNNPQHVPCVEPSCFDWMAKLHLDWILSMPGSCVHWVQAVWSVGAV